MPGKIDALLDDKLQNVEWGEYKLGDLFEIGTGSLLSSGELKIGDIPRISAKSENNGILGHFDTVNLAGARHFENFITVNFFGTDGGIFYHPYKASVEMKVHTLKIPNIEFNSKTGNFIASALKIQLKCFSYGNQLSSSKLKYSDFKIQLPTKNGEIDFAFMESFVAELEASRIAELEAYLIATGMSNWTLTPREEEILETFESHQNTRGGVEINWSEFRIGDLFDISRGNISRQSELINNHSGIVFIAQNDKDNGFVDIVKSENHKQFSGNSLVVGRQTGVVYYQEKQFITTDGVLVLIPKNNFIKNRQIGLALTSLLSKQMFSFGYNNTVSAEKLNQINISLPVQNNQPDYEFMETFISAVQKLVIIDVVIYADKKIAATRDVVNKGNLQN